MTDVPNENHPSTGADERASDPDEHAPDKSPTTGGPWNPLKSLQKTISPAFRAELLRMKRPLLPPEDFMDTADFQRVRAARLRSLRPALVVLGAVILALLLLWGSWQWRAPRRDESNRSKTTQEAQPVLAATEAAPLPSPTLPPSGDVASIESAVAPEPSPQPATHSPVPRETNARPTIRKKPESPRAEAAPSSTPEPAPTGVFWNKP